MRTLVAVVVLLGGCSVEIGAGQVAPVVFDEPIDAAGASPPMSVPMEVEFLSADQSAAIADQYGDKLGAVTAVDVSVQELGIVDAGGAPVTGGILIVAYDGVTIERIGDRLRLPDDAKQQVMQAIAKRAALDWTVRCTVGWSLPAPRGMSAHAVLQPIVVVDALKAL